MPTTTASVPASDPDRPDFDSRSLARLVGGITVALLVIGLCARLVRYAVGAAIWGDEAMLAVNVAGRDFAGLTRALDWGQFAPVLFLWAERVALVALGPSEWAVRLIPFLAGFAGLLAFADLTRRAVPATAAALAIGVLAVSRYPVYMTGTLKPYSGDLFWSALLMALAVRWRRKPTHVWPLAALAAAVPVALGMSFPVVFVAGGVGLYLLPPVWRCSDRRAKAVFVLYGLLMVGTFSGLCRIVEAQKADPRATEVDRIARTEWWAHAFPPTDPGAALVWAVKAHTGRLMAYPLGDGNGGSTASFLLFMAGCVGCWRSGRRELLILCLAPLGLNLIAAAMGRYPYGGCWRISQHLGPPICLMMGVGWAAMLEWVAPRPRAQAAWLVGIAVVLGTFGLCQIVFDLHRPQHGEGGHWTQRIGRVVNSHLRSGDVVVARSDPLVADACFDWYMGGMSVRPIPDLSGPLGHEVGRVWLVVLGTNFSPATEEARLMSALGPGWVTAGRFDYWLTPNAEGAAIRCTVHCLGRADRPAQRLTLPASP